MSLMHIGVNVQDQFLADLKELDNLCTDHIVLFYDSKISNYAILLYRKLLQKGFRVNKWGVKVSESIKNINMYESQLGRLLSCKADRHSLIVVVGGGCLGDLIGFVTGTYLRGLRIVHFPSTLLAQVDSSIGGKTGINFKGGKNLIGCFHLPEAIYFDISLLQTLSLRHFYSGIGEVLKYAFLDSGEFRKEAITTLRCLSPCSESSLIKVVDFCAHFKDRIIKADFKETDNQRIFLNLGHTFAHALESFTHCRVFLHGEAVYWGLHYIIQLSFICGTLSKHLCEDMSSYLIELQPHTYPPLRKKYLSSNILEWMELDKKKGNKKTSFILLSNWGSPIISSEVTTREKEEALRSITKRYV